MPRTRPITDEDDGDKCCVCLNFRRGTILIGIIELVMASFFLFIVILGVSQSQDVANALSGDIDDNETMSESPTEYEYSRNQERLRKAALMEQTILIFLYSVIAVTVVHLISCVLLLYGAVLRIRQLLLPWISIVMFKIVCNILLGLFGLMFAPFGKGVGIVTTDFVFTVLYIYMWLCVFGFYRQLWEVERGPPVIIAQPAATMMKGSYDQLVDTKFPQEL